MSVPNVNCKLLYVQNEDEIAKSPALAEKYGSKRKFYSSNQTQDYLTYVNTGSKEKIDYVAYSGNDEKSCGVFGKNGLLTMNEKKKLRQQLRETKSVIWDCLLTFQPEFGQRYCNDFEQAHEMLKREMPRFLKDAGSVFLKMRPRGSVNAQKNRNSRAEKSIKSAYVGLRYTLSRT